VAKKALRMAEAINSGLVVEGDAIHSKTTRLPLVYGRPIGVILKLLLGSIDGVCSELHFIFL
jgi:hypothetical protein